MNNVFIFKLMLKMQRNPSTAGLIILALAQTIGEIDSAILSRNKTMTSSSTYSNWVPQRALNGNPRRDADDCRCCAATHGQLNPWYELDIGRYYNVNKIQIDGRIDNKDQHFQNMQIYLKSVHDDISTGEETRITEITYNFTYVLPEPKSTRFVSLVLFNVTQIFTICELTVYGDCADGEFGDYCENACHCDGDPCDKTTGVCPSGRCLPGYQGVSCDMYCSDGTYGSSCTERCGNCDGTLICHKQDGRCPGGCADGYQGQRCTQECRDGFYGQECRDECGHCQSGEPCNKVTGHCENDCAAGYQTDVTCRKECTSGTYGVGCTKQCGNCKFGATCAKTNGSCPAGCTGDYTGETCKSVCTAGFYGESCNNDCGQCANGEPCDPEAGICRNGCSAGYQTILCNTECNRDRYGLGCSQFCGNCRGGDFCVITDGTCPNGCEAGYMGDACNTACTDGTYGEACTKQCGSCANGIPCNKTNGACLACVPGYFGSKCQQTESLMESSGNDSLLLTISGWVFGGVTVLAAIGIFVVLRNRSRRAQQKPLTNDTSLYNIPRNSHIEEDLPYDYPIVHTYDNPIVHT